MFSNDNVEREREREQLTVARSFPYALQDDWLNLVVREGLSLSEHV